MDIRISSGTLHQFPLRSDRNATHRDHIAPQHCEDTAAPPIAMRRWFAKIGNPHMRGPVRVPAVEFGWDVGRLLLRKQKSDGLMIASWRTSHHVSRVWVGVANASLQLNLEDARPWFSLFNAIVRQRDPLSLSQLQVCADPRSEDRRERVCCSHFLEMKGSAQDALSLPITAPSGLLVDIQDIRRTPGHIAHHLTVARVERVLFWTALLCFAARSASTPHPWVLG